MFSFSKLADFFVSNNQFNQRRKENEWLKKRKNKERKGKKERKKKPLSTKKIKK